MNIPNLTAYLTSESKRSNALARFEPALKTLEDGLAAKHIWNVDFVEAKDWISRLCDEAMESKAMAWLDSASATDRQSRFAPDDIRWSVYYHPQFSNTPGAYKKLVKFVGKGEGAEFDAAVEMIGEIAQVAELVKSLKPFIVKGRKPSENPKEVDVTNTGICPVCMKRQKLNFDGTMVAHGYTISRGWGGRNGMCIGRGYKAWELSPEGAVVFKRIMVQQLAEENEKLETLNTDKLPFLLEQVQVRKSFGKFEQETKKHDRGTADYDRVKRAAIFGAESNIRYLTMDIEAVTVRITNWKAEPLKYGGAETQERWKSRMLKKQ